MRKSTDTYEHAINGLLQKRQEIMGEMVVARERLGQLANDVEAIDRVLQRLGHDEKLEMIQSSPRHIVFYRGQLRQWLLTQMRELGPVTSRQLAERLVQVQQKDVRDRKLMDEVVNRIARGLHSMHDARMVVKIQTSKRGENTWQLGDA
jgi:predicted GNAT family acetyltransferase